MNISKVWQCAVLALAAAVLGAILCMRIQAEQVQELRREVAQIQTAQMERIDNREGVQE